MPLEPTPEVDRYTTTQPLKRSGSDLMPLAEELSVSSGYVNRADGWKLAFHQQTALQAEVEQSTSTRHAQTDRDIHHSSEESCEGAGLPGIGERKRRRPSDGYAGSDGVSLT
jgi:predicted HNH restriction endonuclease